MNQELLGLAFTAGMVAALNPCGFAMLPPYLSLVVTRDGSRPDHALSRALAATAAMTLGFLTVFGAFGLLTVSVASTLQRYLPYVTIAIGASLVALGLWLLAGRELWSAPPGWTARWAPTARLGSMFGYGLGYAVASLSCTIAPFLAVTGASLRSGSTATGFGVYVAYAGGLGLVVGVLAVAVAVSSTALIARLRRILPYINRISGVILLSVGAYVAYYGWFEIRLLGETGTGSDPVIDGAGRLQRSVAGWVYESGAWPWLIAMAGLSAWAAGAAVAGARRRRDDRAEPDDHG